MNSPRDAALTAAHDHRAGLAAALTRLVEKMECAESANVQAGDEISRCEAVAESRETLARTKDNT